MILNENLMTGDLDHLVLPMVSIDEYSSKIDDARVIVVGFYVSDREPATDLCIFIEKSAVKTLDCEVSPAPTPEGYYLVFVEMDRNKEFPSRLIDLIHEINNLVDISSWQFKPYCDHSEIQELDLENLQKHVELDSQKVADKLKQTSDKLKLKKTQKKSLESYIDTLTDENLAKLITVFIFNSLNKLMIIPKR